MRLEELRVRGVVVRDGRGHLIEFTCKLVRPCRAAKRSARRAAACRALQSKKRTAMANLIANSDALP
jgi:hypothetical protein